MSAINFVVRDVAGNIQRGTVAGEGGVPSLIVGSGADVSLNLSQGQIASFTRQGQALQITLIDGRVILVEGYFAAEGVSENQLFLSSDGYLTEVQLNEGAGEDYFAKYIADDGVGKFAINDDLYFMRSADVMLADSYVPADDEVGMLGAALGGLAPVFGWGGAAAGAALVGGAVIGGGGGGDGGPAAPSVSITSGTEASDHVVNQEDHADGVEIGGEGTPGAEVSVTVDGVTETTTVADDGTWEVIFDSADIATGEYSTPVEVVIINEGGSTTVTDTLVVDTIIDASFTTPGGADGVINLAEHELGTTLTGTVTGGDAVVVTIGGVDYDAVVSGDSWSLDLPTGVLAGGEYDMDVTVTATDAAGNVYSTDGEIVVDTVTDVTVSTATVGGADGVVSNDEHGSGVTLTGTAEVGSTVVVTLGTVSHTVTATDGTWSSYFTAAEVPTGESTLPVTVVATDLAMNTSEASGTVEVDTFVNELTMTTNTAGGDDGVVNFDESGQSITMSGMVEVGSTVSVNLHGVVLPADVDPVTGAWTVTYPAGSLPGGEYSTTVVVTATDAAGNQSSLTEAVVVDTVVGEVALSDAAIEGDDVINANEASDGVVISGTATPGLVVTVTFGEFSQDVLAADGTFSVTFLPGMIPADAASAPITASISDAAGNYMQDSDSVMIDTVVNPFNFSDTAIAGDDIVNRAEADNGVTFTGQVEPFSSVLVEFGGQAQTVTVGSSGQWSATFGASAFLADEYSATVTATATDQHGNVSAPITKTIQVDTVVDPLTTAATVAGDDVVNRSEMTDGVTLSGTVEAGAKSVIITFSHPGGPDIVQAATIVGNTWSLTYPDGTLPEGDYTANITIGATDSNDNYLEITDTFAVDTVLPDTPVVQNVTLSPSGYIATTVETPEHDVSINEITSSHQTNELAVHDADAAVSDGIPLSADSMYFGFDAPLPNGSHLVVNETDSSGNTNATFVVLEETTTNVVDLGGLSGFNIGAIDLGYAQDAELTLDLATLQDLSDVDNNLIIHGSDRDNDQVTIHGAQDTQQTTQIDGRSYDVYTMGDDAQIFIEESITVLN